MTRIALLVTTLVLLSWSNQCCAQHADIMIQQADGQLVTGIANLDSNSFSSPSLVFTDSLLLIASTSNWIGSDPGFFALSEGSVLLPVGTEALPGGLDVFWDFLPMSIGSTASNLFYWDGLDSDGNGLSVADVEPILPTSNLELRINSPGTGVGFGSAAVTGTPDFVAGKKVETTAFDGSIHHHPVVRINATMEDDPPAQGVYLTSLQLRTAGSIEPSEPFFLAFRTSGIAIGAEAAMASWVMQNYEMLIAPPTLAGDFNGDGHVDAADYTVWRDNLGAIDLPLVDADGSGTVDAGDYAIWRSNFGAMAQVGSGSLSTPAATVPELSSCLTAMLLLSGFAVYRHRLFT